MERLRLNVQKAIDLLGTIKEKNLTVLFEFRGKFFDVDDRIHFATIQEGQETSGEPNAVIFKAF